MTFTSLFPSLLVCFLLGSCASTSGGGNGKWRQIPEFRDAMSRVVAEGPVTCMVLPNKSEDEEHIGVVKAGISDSGLAIKVGQGSRDEEKLARYKGLLGKRSDTFDVDADDKALFEGVHYIAIFSTSAKTYQDSVLSLNGYRPTQVFDMGIKVELYWVRNGVMLCHVEAKTTKATTPSFDELGPVIAHQLKEVGLPGTDPIAAVK